MKNKLIRLTEADLHRIIKESVNKVLSEAVNELHPLTYASYADKRAQQHEFDKAYQGKKAAIDSWNKQYGKFDTDDDSSTVTRQLSMYDDEPDSSNPHYRVVNADRSQGNNGNSYIDNYDPHTDMGYTVSRRNGGNRQVSNFRGVPNALNNDAEGIRVARQMAKGDGTYIKGKGWQ